MPVNVRLLRLEVLKQAEPQIRDQIKDIVKLDFETKRDEFLDEFDRHPVTQEIENGPSAYSSDSEISSTGGNLFSLLGFFKEQRPITFLRQYLKRTIRLGNVRPGKSQGDHLLYETPVEMPTLGDIDNYTATDPETRLEWDGRGFTQLIRNGITGLPRYLFSLVKDFSRIPSRSGPAIQVKNSPIHQGSVGPIKYVDELLANLRARINGGR